MKATVCVSSGSALVTGASRTGPQDNATRKLAWVDYTCPSRLIQYCAIRIELVCHCRITHVCFYSTIGFEYLVTNLDGINRGGRVID